jgi:hypothetical protein
MPGKVNDLLYCYHNIRLIQSASADAEAEAGRMRAMGMLTMEEDDEL